MTIKLYWNVVSNDNGNISMSMAYYNFGSCKKC